MNEILTLVCLQDIANHQLQALRPYLLETSPDFELKMFHERQARGLLSLDVTRQWLSKNMPLPSEDPSKNPKSPLTTIDVALCRGLVDLVFFPPTSTSTPSTPLTATTSTLAQSQKPAAAITLHQPQHPQPSAPGYPEALYLDQTRLLVLSTDASDLTALYMVLMLFRQLSFSRLQTKSVATGKKAADIADWEIDRVKREIWEVGPARLGWCFFNGTSGATTTTSTSSATSVEDEACESKWNKGMRDVVLQVCVRAEQVGSGRDAADDTDTTPSSFIPRAETLSMLDGWIGNNMRDNSPLHSLMKRRLRNAVLDAALYAMCPFFQATEDKGTGLEPLMPEIRHLGERIARLALFHARVYRDTIYQEPGFLPPPAST